MSELDKQPFSVRFNQVIGGSAGHTIETALSEIGLDNSCDAEATNFTIINCPSKSSFALLDNGKGIQNINNILGCGSGIKIKSADKIGCKIAGELASIGYLKSNQLMYFSRKQNSEIMRKHQQMNLQPKKIIDVILTKDIDLTVADDIILKGTNSQEKLVCLPVPSRDKFDNDDVSLVKQLFNNNREICDYLDTDTKTGMLKVIKYNKTKSGEAIVNRKKYDTFNNKIKEILDYYEFITYNTNKFIRGQFVITYIDVDDESKNRIIDKNSCRNLLILGKDAIKHEEEEEDEDNDDDEENSCDEDEDEDEESEDDEADEDDDEDNCFGKLNSDKVLTINNTFYTVNNNSNKINMCVIENFDDSYYVVSDSKEDTKYFPKEQKYQCKGPIVKIGSCKIHISVLDKVEATEQKDKMNTTLENMKQIYVYYNGRHLSRCQIPGLKLQPKNLSNLRMALCLNPTTNSLVNIQSNKSKFSLNESEEIIQNTISKIIIPIMSLFDTGKCVIQDSVDNWYDYKTKIIDVLMGRNYVASTQSSDGGGGSVVQINPTPKPQVPTPPPIIRVGGPVERPLLKPQSIEELNQLQKTLQEKRITKKQKALIITKLQKISRNIIEDYDCIDELFEFTKNIITLKITNDTTIVKDAVSLKKFKF